MKAILNDLCRNTGADHRRSCLEAILHGRFPGRLVVERRAWPLGHAVADTFNYLVPFGCQSGHLVLGAHHDTVPDCPGANDNGAAVVQLLEAATQLQAGLTPGGTEPNVTFCFWDHEEHYGSPYMGSRLYLERHADALPAKAVVFDVSGIGNLFVSGRDGAGLASVLPSRVTPPSDNRNLMEAGTPTTLICALPDHEWAESWPVTWNTLHTPRDTPDRVEENTLKKGAEFTLAFIERYRAA